MTELRNGKYRQLYRHININFYLLCSEQDDSRLYMSSTLPSNIDLGKSSLTPMHCLAKEETYAVSYLAMNNQLFAIMRFKNIRNCFENNSCPASRPSNESKVVQEFLMMINVLCLFYGIWYRKYRNDESFQLRVVLLGLFSHPFFKSCIIHMLKETLTGIHLPKIMFAYRSTWHKVSGFSPYYGLLGKGCETALELLLPKTNENSENISSHCLKLKHNLPRAHKIIVKNLQGSNFESKLLKSLCDNLKIRKTKTSPYNLQSNGLAESFCLTSSKLLAKCIHSDDKVDDTLNNVLMAYRISVHKAMKLSPYQCISGKEFLLSGDTSCGVNKSRNGYHDLAFITMVMPKD
ncbi:hypothetical protein RF11_04949 [Thelohanellus kitauei]|uniref:Integrase catalytic domain-containing protein n=1 Tax=Thelohanellus kitauei TaxID=669202 RepID=A0A0C2M8H3_THEKT|nr:hypothetical protein RF11_04949 [Thelohanellus kitauei]